MREDRFFVDFKIKKGTVEIFDKKIIWKIKKVLRKRKKDQIVVVDREKEGLAEIEKILANKIILKILEIRFPKREPEVFVSLYCSILKKSNFELVVQKATEIGVKEIFPIISENTIKLGLNFERLKRIAKEAGEQSGRISLPKIGEILKFEKALLKAKQDDLKIIFDISGGNFFQFNPKNFRKISIFIGPEGGWTKKEIELGKKKGFLVLSLGKLNLRAETAAILATFLAENFFSL